MVLTGCFTSSSSLLLQLSTSTTRPSPSFPTRAPSNESTSTSACAAGPVSAPSQLAIPHPNQVFPPHLRKSRGWASREINQTVPVPRCHVERFAFQYCIAYITQDTRGEEGEI